MSGPRCPTSAAVPAPRCRVSGSGPTVTQALVTYTNRHTNPYGGAMALFGKKKDAGPQPLDTYKVIYRGGLADLPKAKIGEIRLQVWDNRFELQPTISSQKFWQPLVIPYSAIREVSIVDRQESTFEALAGGLDSRQLNEKNNIHIDYSSGSAEALLRLEMLSGVTVMGQARKCREFQDRLRVHGVTAQFAGAAPSGQHGAQARFNGPVDIPGQIAKLADLHAQGILSDQEFEAKKADLLSRM